MVTLAQTIFCGLLKPCRPKWSGMYFSMCMTLCLCRPAFPVPPCLPAPLPDFLPRPWVLVPLNLSVLLTIDLIPPLHIILWMRSLILAPRYPRAPPFWKERFTPSYPLRGGVRRNRGLTSFIWHMNISLAQTALDKCEDGAVLRPLLDHFVVDRLVAHQAATELHHAGQGLLGDLAKGDIVLGLLQHALDGVVLGQYDAVVHPVQLHHEHGVLDVVVHFGVSPDPNNCIGHGAQSSWVGGTSSCCSVMCTMTGPETIFSFWDCSSVTRNSEVFFNAL